MLPSPPLSSPSLSPLQYPFPPLEEKKWEKTISLILLSEIENPQAAQFMTLMHSLKTGTKQKREKKEQKENKQTNKQKEEKDSLVI